MKIKGMTLLCMAGLLVISCASAVGQSNSVSGALTVGQHSDEPKIETINYNWEDFGIDVSFTKRDGDTLWGVTVRDSWDVYEQSKEPSKVWGPSSSKCSQEECLHLVDRSLLRFHAEKPDTQFKYVAIEMQVVRELWGEMLTGLSQKLPTMDGRKSSDAADVPPEIGDELQSVLNKSITVAQIKALLKKHGMDAQGASISDQLLFKKSLNDQKWSEIAALPGLGINTPGVFEFVLDKSGVGSVLDTGAKRFVTSQAVSQ